MVITIKIYLPIYPHCAFLISADIWWVEMYCSNYYLLIIFLGI